MTITTVIMMFVAVVGGLASVLLGGLLFVGAFMTVGYYANENPVNREQMEIEEWLLDTGIKNRGRKDVRRIRVRE